MSETDGTDDLWRGDIGATADAFGVLGLRLRLEQVLLEIFRTGRAMADGREPSAETRERLESLRREASSLEKAIYGASPATPTSPSPPVDVEARREVPSVHGATREARLLARRRRGVRHVVEIDIWDNDLDAMIRRGEISSAEAKDRARVADAVEDLLERTLHSREPSAPAVTSPAEADRRTRDDRREDADRRSEAERRAAEDRRQIVRMWSQLDPELFLSAPDRRATSERRAPVKRRTHPTRRERDEPDPG